MSQNRSLFLSLVPEEEEVAYFHPHFDVLLLGAGIVAESLLRTVDRSQT